MIKLYNITFREAVKVGSAERSHFDIYNQDGTKVIDVMIMDDVCFIKNMFNGDIGHCFIGNIKYFNCFKGESIPKDLLKVIDGYEVGNGQANSQSTNTRSSKQAKEKTDVN